MAINQSPFRAWDDQRTISSKNGSGHSKIRFHCGEKGFWLLRWGDFGLLEVGVGATGSAAIPLRHCIHPLNGCNGFSMHCRDDELVLLVFKTISDKCAGRPYAPLMIPEDSSFADMVALHRKAEIGDRINKQISAPLVAANQQLSQSDVPDCSDRVKLFRGWDARLLVRTADGSSLSDQAAVLRVVEFRDPAGGMASHAAMMAIQARSRNGHPSRPCCLRLVVMVNRCALHATPLSDWAPGLTLRR